MSKHDFHNERYRQWQPRASKHLLTLGPRIVSLGSRFYAGCGFHYSLAEKYLKLRDYLTEPLIVTDEHPEHEISLQIVNEVILEELSRDVAAAEKSAQKLEQA